MAAFPPVIPQRMNFMKRPLAIFAGSLVLILPGISPAVDPAPTPPAMEKTSPQVDAPSSSEKETASATSPSMNKLILEAIHRMPTGGGYSVKKDAMVAIRSAIVVEGAELQVTPEAARPSYCSEATYLAFLKVIETLLSRHELQLTSAELRMFLVGTQADGEGIWGRWNANGPGTARLFYELGLGPNFPTIDSAQPGDFLKVFWTDEIGAKEFGHSVIYLGRRMTPQGEVVRFWSSNIKVGYSEKEVPLAKMKRVVVSRFEHPENLHRLLQLPKKDAFLASMLTESCPPEVMLTKVGIKNSQP